MTKDDFWNELNERLNACIGQLVVPRMQTRNPDVVAVHDKLLDLAHWVDESLGEDFEVQK